MQGLVIDEPWITKILRGEKTWEMRSKKNLKTGFIALIKKGSGTIVGVAKLDGSPPPLTRSNWMQHFNQHQVPAEFLDDPKFNWFIPWVLTDVRRLSQPVKYDHPNGAVTFVNLSDSVACEVQQNLGQSTNLGLSPLESDVPKKRKLTPISVALKQPVVTRGMEIRGAIAVISGLGLAVSSTSFFFYFMYCIITWSGSFKTIVILSLAIMGFSALWELTVDKKYSLKAS
jgi:ASCH domain